MLKGLTWEEETRARIDRATAERDKAKGVYDHWIARLNALETALQLERTGLNGSGSKKDLASISVNDALIEIAKGSGGLVVTKHAIETLVKAGVFSTRGAANDNIHSTLRRSPHFRKERRGVYRLIAADGQAQPTAHKTRRASPGHLSEVIGRLLAERPALTHKELVKAVQATGFDFGEKNPGLATNMARQRLRRVKRAKNLQPHNSQAVLPSLIEPEQPSLPVRVPESRLP